MALPNEKPNTLHSAFIVGVHFRMGSFWPWHMAPQKTTAHWEYWRCFHACGSCPRQALVITFIIACFLCGCREAHEDSQAFVLFIPSSFSCCLCPKEKREKQKNRRSEISTINFQSTLLCFLFPSFLFILPLFCQRLPFGCDGLLSL